LKERNRSQWKEGLAMNHDNSPGDDSACPAAFIAIPAVVGALLWVWVMLTRMPQY
jgi:hypothetical protein